MFLDNVLEGNETFTLGLSIRVPRVSASSSRDTATGIIIDSTSENCLFMHVLLIIMLISASVMFEQATYRINENSGSPLRPVLLLSQPFPTDMNVLVRAENVTATGRIHYNIGIMACVCLIAPGDYGPQELYNVSFPAGSERESFDVNIVSDDILESDETFLLDITIMMLPNGIIIGEPASVEVTIIETTGES